MSHCIEAQDARQRALALLELTERTVESLTLTGFDVYQVYRAQELNAGVSGLGESVAVDAHTARRAHLTALAWASALQRRSPNRFEATGNAPIPREALDYQTRREVMAAAEAIWADLADSGFTEHDPAIADSIDRCESVLAFTRAVYEAAANEDVEIFFG